MSESAVQDPEEAATESAPASQPPAGEQGLAPRQSHAATIGFGTNARNWDEGFRIANQLAKSELVPKIYRDKPQDIVVAMQLGAELGLPPMQSLQSIAVINGRPGVFGDGFLGVIMAAPSYARHSEYFVVNAEQRDFLTADDLTKDDTTAVCSFWRRGNPNPFTATFSVGDAKRANLLGKEGPWRTYPARMLKMRARGFAGRDAFAGELRGMKTAEELLDTPIDVTVETPIAASAPAEPIRRSEKSAPPESSASAQEASAAAPIAESTNVAPAKPAGAAKTTKAAAAATPSAPGQVTKNVRIDETQYVGKPANGVQPYYEIQGVLVAENGAARSGFTWLTRDEQLAKLAESCAGSSALFTVTWHEAAIAADKSKRAVKVMTGLQAAN